MTNNCLKFSTKIIIYIFTIFLFMGGFFTSAVLATDDPALRARIEAKSLELSVLNTEINRTQSRLNNIHSQRRTLSREIQSTEYAIRNLELNIRRSEINIERLTLELEDLENKINETEEMIEDKRLNISSLIRAMHQAERGSFLERALAGESLTDSITELSDLETLRQSIEEEITSLENLSQLLSESMQAIDSRKTSIEREQINLSNRRIIAQEEKTRRETVLRTTRNQEAVYQRQLAELERRQKSVSDEIEDLESVLRQDFNVALAPGRGFLIRPFTGRHPITQPFGSTRFARTAYRTRFHNGIDYGMPIGTPILAAASGRVFAVGNNGRYQYGRYIAIKHTDNFFTLYAHLSRESVTVGQLVNQGDIIGHSGNTGFSTGPHLHLGVYQTMELRRFSRAGVTPIGVTMNPADYL